MLLADGEGQILHFPAKLEALVFGHKRAGGDERLKAQVMTQLVGGGNKLIHKKSCISAATARDQNKPVVAVAVRPFRRRRGFSVFPTDVTAIARFMEQSRRKIIFRQRIEKLGAAVNVDGIVKSFRGGESAFFLPLPANNVRRAQNIAQP